MWQSHSIQVHSVTSHCQLSNPMGECSCMRSKVPFDWLPSCMKTVTSSQHIQNGSMLSRQIPYIYIPFYQSKWIQIISLVKLLTKWYTEMVLSSSINNNSHLFVKYIHLYENLISSFILYRMKPAVPHKPLFFAIYSAWHS